MNTPTANVTIERDASNIGPAAVVVVVVYVPVVVAVVVSTTTERSTCAAAHLEMFDVSDLQIAAFV